MNSDMDLPFEEGPPGQTIDLEGEHAQIASGAVIIAGAVPVTGIGMMACLVYRFAKPDGSGFYPPVVLVADDDQLRKTTVLTSDAVSAAVRAARKARAQ